VKNLLLLFLLFSLSGKAQKFPDLALTPPMGWNSWNYFQCDGINEQVIKETADAMVANGMKEAGYEYIVIDDCWQVGRDASGEIIVDSLKFPHGMKYLADYIHGKGLKFGIYSDAGT
jgi:alpha-galactosidase